jgi:hypothetical protein
MSEAIKAVDRAALLHLSDEVEAGLTVAELESALREADVGRIEIVLDPVGTLVVLYDRARDRVPQALAPSLAAALQAALDVVREKGGER